MNLLRNKWLILDIYSRQIVNFTDFVMSDKLWQVYNSTKAKQNRSSVATVSSTHAGASSELWCHRHLRTLRSGLDQAHHLPEAPVPWHTELGRTSPALSTS